MCIRDRGNTGAVTLTGTGNSIGAIGSYSVTGGGGFALTNGSGIGVVGKVSASGANIVLTSTGTGPGGAISLSNTGTLAAGTGTVTAQADAFSVTGNGSVTGAMFEYAPNSSEALTLGTGGNIVDLTGIATTAVRLGAVNGSVIATGITTVGTFDLGVGNSGHALPLDLEATGTVTDGGTFPFLNVSTLTGTVSGGSLSLTNNSAGIASIGGFTVTGINNGFTIQQPTGTLIVNGPLSAPSITLASGNIKVPGSISTGGLLSLTANPGTISGAGTIAAGTLAGSASTTINLSGTNQIGTLGSLTGTAITLNDGTALTIANTVSASGSVALTSGGLLTVGNGQTVTGTSVALTGTSLAITGEVTDGGSGTVTLVATTGSISEAGTIVALSLIHI